MASPQITRPLFISSLIHNSPATLSVQPTKCQVSARVSVINPLTPNHDYSGRTTTPTSKCCIIYIYSTNIGTEYFKHGIYSPFFSLQNAVCFINLAYLVPVLFTFYILSVLKLKKNNSGAKRLNKTYIKEEMNIYNLGRHYSRYRSCTKQRKIRIHFLLCVRSFDRPWWAVHST